MIVMRALWVCGLTLLATTAEAWGAGGYTVRLAVALDLPSVTVKGTSVKVLDGDVRDVLVLDQNRPLVIKPEGNALHIQGIDARPRSVIISSQRPIMVNGRSLVGQVEIIKQKGKRMLVVNRLSLDRYLEGLLGAEMSSSWPVEALRAQAVASRTFAVRRCLEREAQDYDLSTTTLDQVYAGIGRESGRTRQAVESTAGEVLTWDSVPIEALFHSCCGGHTRPAVEVFGSKVPYLVAVKDTDCGDCPAASWKATVSMETLAGRLQARKSWKGPVTRVDALPREGSNLLIKVGGQGGQKILLTRKELRHLLGVKVLKSNEFVVVRHGSDLDFHGHGSGHGVGMCQWGARGMALRGKKYREILNRYYPGTRLRKMY